MKIPHLTRAAAVCGLLSLELVLICSCTTTGPKSQPWMKGGQRIGTIFTYPRPWGSETQYKDMSGRLLRTEKRRQNGSLFSGACTTTYSYNGGALTEVKCLDSDGRLTCNAQGYAACRWSYGSDDEGDRVVEESFFNQDLQPVRISAGYAILRRLEKDGRANRIEFLDVNRKPAPSSWLGVANVVEVDYAYLQGVTPVTCVAFLDSSGNVIQRRQLTGLTEGTWGSSYTTYYYLPHR